MADTVMALAVPESAGSLTAVYVPGVVCLHVSCLFACVHIQFSPDVAVD